MLQHVLLGAVGGHVLAGGGGGQLGRGAVLVGGADIEGVVAPGPLEAGIDVGRQHRSRQIAQVLDAVDVRQGGGDQDAGHAFASNHADGGRAWQRTRSPDRPSIPLGPSPLDHPPPPQSVAGHAPFPRDEVKTA
jgi:hypothetical protein